MISLAFSFSFCVVFLLQFRYAADDTIPADAAISPVEGAAALSAF